MSRNLPWSLCEWKKYRVRRRRAFAAEVEDGRHQRLTEVAHPDVVDGDARGQRVRRAGDPLGQRFPATAAGGWEGDRGRGGGVEVVLARFQRAAEGELR